MPLDHAGLLECDVCHRSSPPFGLTMPFLLLKLSLHIFSIWDLLLLLQKRFSRTAHSARVVSIPSIWDLLLLYVYEGDKLVYLDDCFNPLNLGSSSATVPLTVTLSVPALNRFNPLSLGSSSATHIHLKGKRVADDVFQSPQSGIFFCYMWLSSSQFVYALAFQSPQSGIFFCYRKSL